MILTDESVVQVKGELGLLQDTLSQFLSQCVGGSNEFSVCYGSYHLGDILVITRQ